MHFFLCRCLVADCGLLILILTMRLHTFPSFLRGSTCHQKSRIDTTSLGIAVCVFFGCADGELFMMLCCWHQAILGVNRHKTSFQFCRRPAPGATTEHRRPPIDKNTPNMNNKHQQTTSRIKTHPPTPLIALYSSSIS